MDSNASVGSVTKPTASAAAARFTGTSRKEARGAGNDPRRAAASTGDVDQHGDVVNELLGRVTACGTSLEDGRYTERAQLNIRLGVACNGDQEQAAAVRRMLGCALLDEVVQL